MDTLRLTAPVELAAAATAADDPASVDVLAYTGGLMKVPGHGHVVIDLAGLELSASVTLLANHEATLNGVVGSGTALKTADRLTVQGGISRKSPAGSHIIALHRDGVQWQASVGVDIRASELIPAGRSVEVNGRRITSPAGGMKLVTAGLLRELTICPLGCDPGTTVSIAAQLTGSKTMTFAEWMRERGFNPAELNATQATSLRAMYDAQQGGDPEQLQAAERQRLVDSVDRVAASYRYDDEAALSILRRAAENGTMDENAIELDILRASRGRGLQNFKVPGGSSGGIDLPSRDVLCASLMLRAGNEELAVQSHGERAVEAARRMRIGNLVDLCAHAIRADEGPMTDIPHDRDEMIRAAFSTKSLPNILGDVTGRTLEKAYMEMTSDLQNFVTYKSAADFRSQKAIRPTSIESLRRIGPDGEIHNSDLGEEDTYDWSVGTFARMISFNREQVVNDDLGLVAEIPGMLATAASRTLLDLLWETIMGGETANFFASGNANLLEAGSELGATALASAVATFKSQTDSRGNDISLKPNVLAVPPALEVDARALLRSAEIRTTASDALLPTANPVQGIIPHLIVESRLGNTTKFANASDTAYYLFGPPMSSAIIVGHLQGKRAPTIQSDQHDFEHLGMRWRCYFDFGVALGDFRSAQKNTGEAAG